METKNATAAAHSIEVLEMGGSIFIVIDEVIGSEVR
jgi:hypothetical protein